MSVCGGWVSATVVHRWGRRVTSVWKRDSTISVCTRRPHTTQAPQKERRKAHIHTHINTRTHAHRRTGGPCGNRDSGVIGNPCLVRRREFERMLTHRAGERAELLRAL